MKTPSHSLLAALCLFMGVAPVLAQSPKTDMVVGVTGGTSLVWQNTGSCASPAFTRTASWDLPDVGSDAAPGYGDFDADGDFDMLVGSASGGLKGYRNTGSGTSPSWQAESAWDVSNTGAISKVPAFADLDNDGDLDIMIGNTNGFVYAYRNTGHRSSPSWSYHSSWNTVDVGSNVSPALADLDNDGDYDILVGRSTGHTYAYRNTGSVSSPTWTRQASWDPAMVVGAGAAPSHVDRDCDGDYDLYIGSIIGTVYAYTNTGSVSSPSWSAIPGLNITGVGNNAQVIMVDLDENGAYTHRTISAGSWSSASTWLNGNIPSASAFSGTLLISSPVTISSGNLQIQNHGFIQANADVTVSSGNLIIDAGTLTANNASITVGSGNVELTNLQSRLYVYDSEFSVSGNFINTTGQFTFNGACGDIGQGFSNSGLGSGSFTDAQMIFSSSSSGNFQNNALSSISIANSSIKVANGNFSNSGFLSFMSGSIVALWIPNGDLTNSGGGVWLASVAQYCVSGSVSISSSWLPPSEDCAGISGSFETCGSFLPVEIVSFSATTQNDRVVLNWTTAAELNSDYYIVERSQDGINWTEVGRVPARGNTTVLSHYSLVDENPKSGTTYYRLGETDIDGTRYGIGIDKVSIASDATTVTFANPSSGDVKLYVSSPTETRIELSVVSVLGQVVYDDVLDVPAHAQREVSLDQTLAPGNYIVTWRDAVEVRSSALVVGASAW